MAKSSKSGSGGGGRGSVRALARSTGGTLRTIPAGSRLAEKGFKFQFLGGNGSLKRSNIVARNLPEMRRLLNSSISFRRGG